MRTPQKLAFVALLGLALWLPRGLALDRFVTVDEPSWLTFSGNFYRALARGDLEDTFQIAHPGVTTTWIGAAAFRWRYPAYASDAPGQVDWVRQDVGAYVRANGHDPIQVLAAGRTLMVVAISIVLTVAAVVASRLVGGAAALLGFVLIAGDPFHIALSRVLHVDGLVSSLMLLSVLACLSYVERGRRRRDLILSGVAAGLAWLTKAPALFLVPFVGLLLLGELWPAWRRQWALSGRELRSAARPLVTWGFVGLLVFVIAWPAVWVDPIHSFGAIVADAVGYARTGHTEAPQFFNGAIVYGNPGLHFYPIAYLWRTTPIVLAGLAFAALAFAFPRSSPLGRPERRVALVLAAYALLFTLLMTVAAKKFDRYLLPAHITLDLVAAIGWVAAARWAVARWQRLARGAVPAAVVAAAAGQFAVALPAFPYYFSYYNPMLGGTVQAPRVMMIGWGEGLDQAARYLNALPHAERLRVATWFWNGTFSYFFKGRIVPGRLAPDTTRSREWITSDYGVLYINLLQRGRVPREVVEHVRGLTPVKVVRIQGLEYARVYDFRTSQASAAGTGQPSGHARPVTPHPPSGGSAVGCR